MDGRQLQLVVTLRRSDEGLSMNACLAPSLRPWIVVHLSRRGEIECGELIPASPLSTLVEEPLGAQ